MQRDERRPVAGAVHEGRCGERAVQVAVGGARHHLVDGRDRLLAGNASAHGGEEDVRLAPQHALRHAGRAAGVDHVEVVVARAQRERRVAARRQGVLVVARARQQRLAAAVGDLEQEHRRRQLRQDPRQHRREARVVDERAHAGVAQQVDELVLDVAIVDVEGDGARLRAADHRLEVLVAVVEIETDVILAGLPGRERGALAMAAEPRVGEQVREPPTADRELAPGQTSARGDDGLALGDRGGDGFVQIGEREGHLAGQDY